MRKLLPLSLLSLFVSCEQRNEFTNLTNNFSEATIEIFDSTFFANNFKVSDIKLSKMPNEFRSIVADETINKLTGEQFTYDVYYFKKIDLGEITALTYYVNLNGDIPFDAYVQRVILCTYNTKTGELIDSEEIATLEQHFGHTIRRFSKWNDKTITTKDLETKENISENTTTEKRQECTLDIDQKGKIEISCS